MSTNFEQAAVPLFGEVVDGYNQRMASGIAERESADLRRARQSAFEKFRLLGFPTIKHEDWKYTNLNRFLKEEYSIEDKSIQVPKIPNVVIPGLDAYRVVLVNGVWDRKVSGGPLPSGLVIMR